MKRGVLLVSAVGSPNGLRVLLNRGGVHGGLMARREVTDAVHVGLLIE